MFVPVTVRSSVHGRVETVVTLVLLGLGGDGSCPGGAPGKRTRDRTPVQCLCVSVWMYGHGSGVGLPHCRQIPLPRTKDQFLSEILEGSSSPLTQ